MNYKNILITGGAGFVGSNLAIKLKKDYPDTRIIVLDNLMRRGSELNLSRLKIAGIEFMHGDIRNKEDLRFEEKIDLILECSAEPSVLAGVGGSPEYVINANLFGTVNCLELARIQKADFIFLSTSRVYPATIIEKLKYRETENRFELEDKQDVPGVSQEGFSEDFPIGSGMDRSFYGATKLCSEYLIHEYSAHYGIKAVVNRCGVITGPWQMGKVDQGLAVLWMARHFWPEKNLSYIGYGGSGKQVRDFIHIDDIFEVVKIQTGNIEKYGGGIYNIGGGVENSLSLKELTGVCQEITGNKINIESIKENRPNDVRLYISDCAKFKNISGWKQQKDVKQIFQDIHDWMAENEADLKDLLK